MGKNIHGTGMADRPLVTVITPVLNQEKQILTVLESVASQKYDHLEHIIIDGASSDGTTGIVRNFMENHPGVRLLSEPDTGVYNAMNKGLDLSAGNWIMFLGADDRFFNDSVLDELFLSGFFNEEQVVYGNVSVVGDTSWAKDGTIYDGPFDLKKLFIRNLCHQAVIYPRSTVGRIGHYSEEYHVSSDWDYNLRCFKYYRFTFAGKVISFFNSGGLSTTGADTLMSQDYLEKILRYFDLDPYDITAFNPDSPFYYPMARYRESEHVTKIQGLLEDSNRLHQQASAREEEHRIKITRLHSELEEVRSMLTHEIVVLRDEITNLTNEHLTELEAMKAAQEQSREEKEHLMLVLELNQEDTRQLILQNESETARSAERIATLEKEAEFLRETIANRETTIRVILESWTWKSGKFLLSPLQYLLNMFGHFHKSNG